MMNNRIVLRKNKLNIEQGQFLFKKDCWRGI